MARMTARKPASDVLKGDIFRPGDYRAVCALVSEVQAELARLGPDNGRARNCVNTYHDSVLVQLCLKEIRNGCQTTQLFVWFARNAVAVRGRLGQQGAKTGL
jgi:hypothetical protein